MPVGPSPSTVSQAFTIGDELPDGETVIVVANHRYWLDWAAILQLAATKKLLGGCKLFVKDVIKYTPGTIVSDL